MNNYCTNCGTKLEKDYKYCKNCGMPIINDKKINNNITIKNNIASDDKMYALISIVIFLISFLFLNFKGSLWNQIGIYISILCILFIIYSKVKFKNSSNIINILFLYLLVGIFFLFIIIVLINLSCYISSI